MAHFYGHHRPMRRSGLLCVGSVAARLLMSAVLLVIWGAWSPLAAKVAVIPVEYADEAEILPLAQSLRSPTGRISFDRRTHSLVVVDTPEAIDRIRDLVRRIDLPPEIFVVRLRRQQPRKERGAKGAVRGQISGSGWSAGTDGSTEDHVDITLDQRQHQSDPAGEQVMRVRAGSPAYFAAGILTPDADRRNTLCSGSVQCRQVASYQHVEAGLEITPTRQGKQVTLRVTPGISSAGASTGRQVRISEGSTTIQIPVGQWVDLGALASAESASIDALLTRGDAGDRAHGQLWVRVDPAP